MKSPVEKKMVSPGLPMSLVITSISVLIITLLTWITAKQIYMKLVVYDYPAAVKPWMWVNVVVGGISLMAIILIVGFHRFQLSSPAAWWMGGIVLLNVLLRIVEEVFFFGGGKGQWVG